MSVKTGAVVLLSGGLDSSTLVYDMQAKGVRPLFALSVLYGQRHDREVDAARDIAAVAGVPWSQVSLTQALAPVFAPAESSQVGERVDVPHGHYAAENMKVTIVPNRNMLLLAVAGAFAASRGLRTIAYAAHAGDHPIYPDCRPEFIEAVGLTLQRGSELSLYAPYQEMTKAEVLERGLHLGVPYGMTYSCYRGEERHCGLCGTCVERLEAFERAGARDPVRYDDGIDA